VALAHALRKSSAVGDLCCRGERQESAEGTAARSHRRRGGSRGPSAAARGSPSARGRPPALAPGAGTGGPTRTNRPRDAPALPGQVDGPGADLARDRYVGPLEDDWNRAQGRLRDRRIRATSQQLPVTSNATRSDGSRLSARVLIPSGVLGTLPADRVTRSSQIATTQKSRCTSKPIARPTHVTNAAILTSTHRTVDMKRRTSGTTTQTDTSSIAQSWQVAGAAERIARARSPSSKNGLPVCVLPTKDPVPDRPTLRPERTEPPRRSFMPRLAIVCGPVDVAQLLRLRERHSRDHRPAGRLPRRCVRTRPDRVRSELAGAKDEREQRLSRQR
jgi:hypothetical protein